MPPRGPGIGKTPATAPAGEDGRISYSARLRPLADPTLRYIVEARPLHDQLRQVLTQVAGFSLLVVTRARSLPMLDGPVVLAETAFRATRDRLDSLQAPPPARHHRHHLGEAACALERSLGLLIACLRPAADDATQSTLLRNLQLATDHLRAAARQLPGFEMADLRQACCAAHGRPMAPA